MKIVLKSFVLLFAITLVSCGGKEEKKKESFSVERTKTTEKPVEKAPVVSDTPASKTVDLDNKGVGPVKSVALGAEIDKDMAKKGEETFNKMCTACHKTDKKFIGPSPSGILNRRSPEWVMNMILAPDVMIREDPLAKKLLAEFNGAPMANQGLTEEQARNVLEYFRTLE